MEEILKEIGLSVLIEKFKEERIDEKIALSLTDSELIRLGVDTIGDRARFRELCKVSTTSGDDSDKRATTSTCASGSGATAETTSGLNQDLRRERALLFNPRSRSRSRTTGNKKKEGKKRTWTANFVCLSDRLTNKVPSSAEKQVLQKAGLGSKKIKFDVDDDEKIVIEKITCAELDDKTGDVCGFPKLKNGGGFEFMHCVANCRTLSVIECASSVKELKANIGGQSKIYLRPIQRNLSTTPIIAETTSQVTEKCHGCGQEVLVRNLRRHVWLCSGRLLSRSDSDGDTDTEERQPPLISVHTEATPESRNGVQGENAEQVETPAVIVIDPPVNSSNDEQAPEHVPSPPENADSICSQAIDHCIANEISEPVEILRYFQQVFVTGRQLDITNPTLPTNGATNYILVDRGNILQTAFDEVRELEDLRMTLQVQFYEECADDYGGPRKEFFRLVMNAIKEKYFDKGIREHLADDYETVGILMGE